METTWETPGRRSHTTSPWGNTMCDPGPRMREQAGKSTLRRVDFFFSVDSADHRDNTCWSALPMESRDFGSISSIQSVRRVLSTARN